MKLSLALTALLAEGNVRHSAGSPRRRQRKSEPRSGPHRMVPDSLRRHPTPLVNLVTPTFKSLMKTSLASTAIPNAGGRRL